MKKFIVSVLMIAVAVVFVSCTGGGTTVDQSWARNESLSYSVYDSDKGGAKVGDASFVTTTVLSDEDKAAESKADTKMTSTLRIGESTRVTVFYAKIYNVLSLTSKYTDGTDPKADYELTAHHDGKNYVYSLKYPNAPEKNKDGKLNVGKSGYTDAEFLYFYVRCYDISAVPSSIKIADPFTDTVTTVSCKATASNASVATESALGTVICNKVEINRSETPVGRGISIYYLPETKEYTYGEGSMIKSVCFPTKIVENNISFVLNDFSASK